MYTGVLVSELFGYREPLSLVSVSKQGLGIWTKVKKLYLYDRQLIQGFWWSDHRGLKNLRRTSLAGLEAGKKPFYYFWQFFYPRGLGIGTKRQKIRIPRPQCITYNSFRLDVGSWMVDDHISFGDEERPELTNLPVDLAVWDLYKIRQF